MVHGGQRDGHRRGPAVSGGLSDRIQAHRIDHSSGLVGLAAAIAQQAAAVFGGTFADRHDRKTLIIVNATAGVICWGSVAALLMAGKLVFPVLLAIAVFESAVNGFLGPASDAMLKSIVDIRSYPKARSLNEGRDATINMAGSPVGGLL